MNKIIDSDWPNGFCEELTKIIKCRYSKLQTTFHLDDLVEVLLHALSEGELEINILNSPPPKNQREAGWPYSHLNWLLESGLLNSDDSPIIVRGNNISWRRWNNETQLIINDLRKRKSIPKKKKVTNDRFEHNMEGKKLNDQQTLAIKAVDEYNLILISGGPGTGKTITISEMIRRVISLKQKIIVGLTAPTGKATRRLKETLQEDLNRILNNQHNVSVNLTCTTLHRLLEATPNGFRRNKEKPIELDLLIVDEMSMVDFSLFKALLDALPLETQLVLVGDPNQLPPIGTGAIWHILHQKQFEDSFKNCSIQLTKLYRNKGALALISSTLRKYDSSIFWKQLKEISKTDNVELHTEDINSTPPIVLEQLYEHLRKLNKTIKGIYRGKILIEENSLECSLKTLESLMVLCPNKKGFWGVEGIHRSLLGESLDKGVESWPEGTPVMCTQNQLDLDLSNGDIGLIVGQGVNRRILFRIISETSGLTTRLIHPARIKLLEPAFATTIHKSQGSEAKHVFLLWPEIHIDENPKDSENQCLNYKEKLLYTAITRAKERLDIITPFKQEL